MRKDYVVDLIDSVIGDKVKSVMLVERLMDEGLLVLGYGNADVDRIVDKFKETFGTTKVSKYDRFAAGRLAKKYGSQAIVGIIDLLAGLQTEKYAPVTNSVVQLEEKLPSILNFLRKQRGEEVIDV